MSARATIEELLLLMRIKHLQIQSPYQYHISRQERRLLDTIYEYRREEKEGAPIVKSLEIDWKCKIEGNKRNITFKKTFKGSYQLSLHQDGKLSLDGKQNNLLVYPIYNEECELTWRCGSISGRIENQEDGLLFFLGVKPLWRMDIEENHSSCYNGITMFDKETVRETFLTLTK
jgi:hypothetical protein